MATAGELDAFLARPLVCHLATDGPTVRPVWFLWEDGCFWVLSGAWSALPVHIETHARVALVVDTCNLDTGETVQVASNGHAELVAFDAERGARLLARYLGREQRGWDPRFRRYLRDEPSTVWIKIQPDQMRIVDLSFQPSPQ